MLLPAIHSCLNELYDAGLVIRDHTPHIPAVSDAVVDVFSSRAERKRLRSMERIYGPRLSCMPHMRMIEFDHNTSKSKQCFCGASADIADWIQRGKKVNRFRRKLLSGVIATAAAMSRGR
jgi:hypothetical protein